MSARIFNFINLFIYLLLLIMLLFYEQTSGDPIATPDVCS